MDKLAFLLVFIFFFASCSEDDQVAPDTNLGEGVSCEVVLSVASMEGDISTRSTTVETIDENLISGLWAFQFEDASNGGSGALLNKYYVTVEDSSKIDVLLKANETGKKSNIYFVANVGKTDLDAFSGNETAFKMAVQKVTSEQGFLLSGGDPNQTQKCIPMSGNLLAQTVTAAGIYGGIKVRLVRMLARIDFQYSVGSIAAGKFSIKTVQARNIVNRMAYFRQETSSFPQTIGASDVFYSDIEPATSGTIISGSSPEIRQLTYYIPENIRGNGSNFSGLDKMKSGVPFATYFELYGEGIGAYSGEKFLVRLYPGNNTQNNYSVKRNTRYVLTANLANLSLSDRRILKVGSNCYIVKPGESVSIPISRANESLLDLQIPDIYNSNCTASLYWETGVTAGEVVTLSNTNCSGGTFTVNGVDKGNAVIALRNNDTGRILWSWHIWVSDADFKSSNTISLTANLNSYTFMDRNLGATEIAGSKDSDNNYQTYIATAGMLYQWGRKDPFLPPAVDQSNIVSYAGTSPITAISQNNIKDNYIAVGATTANGAVYVNHGDTYLMMAPLTNTGSFAFADQLSYSVLSPMLLLQNWGGSTARTSTTDFQPNLMGIDSWGGEYFAVKTVYDPCPTGWRVPSYREYDSDFSPWEYMAKPSNNWASDKPYFQTPANGAFCDWLRAPVNYGLYSVPGYRDPLTGAYVKVGSSCRYWLASGFGYNNGSYAMLFTAYNTSFDNLNRGAAASVRCVKER